MTVNALLVRYVGGWFFEEDAASISSIGRIEDFLTLGAVKDRTTARHIARAALDLKALPTVAIGAAIEPVDDTDTPYVAWGVGDYVTAPDETGTPAMIRCVAITVSEDGMGNALYAPELGTIRQEKTVRLERWLQALQPGTLGGEIRTGTPPDTGAPDNPGPAGDGGGDSDVFVPPSTCEEDPLCNPTFTGQTDFNGPVDFGDPVNFTDLITAGGGLDLTGGAELPNGQDLTSFGNTVAAIGPDGDPDDPDTLGHVGTEGTIDDHDTPGLDADGAGRVHLNIADPFSIDKGSTTITSDCPAAVRVEYGDDPDHSLQMGRGNDCWGQIPDGSMGVAGTGGPVVVSSTIAGGNGGQLTAVADGGNAIIQSLINGGSGGLVTIGAGNPGGFSPDGTDGTGTVIVNAAAFQFWAGGVPVFNISANGFSFFDSAGNLFQWTAGLLTISGQGPGSGISARSDGPMDFNTSDDFSVESTGLSYNGGIWP